MKTGEKQSLSVFLGVLLFFLPVVSIFFLFSEGFSNLLVKYFPAEQKQNRTEHLEMFRIKGVLNISQN